MDEWTQVSIAVPCFGAEEGDVEHTAKKRCPLVSDPLDKCYVTVMDSQQIDKALYYCGGHFEQCEIYQEWLRSHQHGDSRKGNT